MACYQDYQVSKEAEFTPKAFELWPSNDSSNVLTLLHYLTVTLPLHNHSSYWPNRNNIGQGVGSRGRENNQKWEESLSESWPLLTEKSMNCITYQRHQNAWLILTSTKKLVSSCHTPFLGLWNDKPHDIPELDTRSCFSCRRLVQAAPLKGKFPFSEKSLCHRLTFNRKFLDLL